MTKRTTIIIVILLLVAGSIGVGIWRTTTDNQDKPQNNGTSQTAQSGKKADSGSADTDSADSGQPPSYPVKVYFSKHPDSDDSIGAVFPVSRNSPDLGVARYSISELLKGPTAAEASQGYFSTVRLRPAVSTCGNQDFKVTISNGTATLRFCKPFDHVGIAADGQAKSAIDATLKQFNSVKKTIILNQAGDCEFDLSGMNLCKQ